MCEPTLRANVTVCYSWLHPSQVIEQEKCRQDMPYASKRALRTTSIVLTALSAVPYLVLLVIKAPQAVREVPALIRAFRQWRRDWGTIRVDNANTVEDWQRAPCLDVADTAGARRL